MKVSPVESSDIGVSLESRWSPMSVSVQDHIDIRKWGGSVHTWLSKLNVSELRLHADGTIWDSAHLFKCVVASKNTTTPFDIFRCFCSYSVFVFHKDFVSG